MVHNESLNLHANQFWKLEMDIDCLNKCVTAFNVPWNVLLKGARLNSGIKVQFQDSSIVLIIITKYSSITYHSTDFKLFS